MIKCICFARVSTQQQDLTAQVADVKRAAIYDGYLESEITVVEGKESAIKLSEEERQTLRELNEIVSANPSIESIYFFAVDRLARRMSVIMSVKEWADENKINLVFLNPQRMDTLKRASNGEWVENEITTLLLSMLAYGAQMEMKTKKARFMTSKEAMRKRGQLAQGKPCYGYKVDANNYVVVDEEEAQVVRGIFNDYLTGEYNLRSIFNKYMKSGIFDVFTNETGMKMKIHRILTNAKYAGIAVNSQKKNKDTGEFYKSITQYPPIISEETFYQAQELLKAKKNLPKQDTKTVYYAKGLVKCPCGHTMVAHKSVVNYKCNKHGHNFAVNLNVIDSLAWNTAKAWYGYYASIDLANTKKENEVKLEDYQAEIRVLEEKVSFEQDRRDKIAVKYANGKVSEAVFDKIVTECDKHIKAFNNQIAEWKTKIANLLIVINNTDIKEYVDIRDLEKLSDEERVKVIRKVIKEIRVSTVEGSNFSVKVEFFPTEILDWVNLDFQPYYIYTKRGCKLELSSYFRDKIAVKDATFLIHRRFKRELKKKK